MVGPGTLADGEIPGREKTPGGWGVRHADRIVGGRADAALRLINLLELYQL